jgi:hypothetical protein
VNIISSTQTFLMKKVFPVFWFGFLAVFMVMGGVGGAWKDPLFVVVPLFMAAIGFLLMRKLVWNLADEVRDGGDVLLVRRGGDEERVPLSNVMNVGMSQFTNPKRLALRLRKPGKFGDEVVFIPKSGLQFNPFARNKVAEDLIARVDRLRNHDGSGP